ncbi:class I SAM-dependent methyltransferase [Bradyrhizobium sp. 200]|uniref:class I SAM-dependent methyltransferase n=1 Tax=Bradyrhizobium sp. 200 TaxID=2782665 RepID=UPI001FFFC28D|nr:class I SAM-dependent methyltransferase [Bradyrhizobium sp. 200]UPJ51867.1 class I SAM-dependent methyltransferase [Bradyrhizobium sp. 200]
MTSYASYTRNTAEPIKAIAHSRRFQQAAKIIAALPSDTVLDYGCADAHLFSVLGPVKERAGYEPDPKMVAQVSPNLRDVRIYTDRDELLSSGRRFSLVVCMEVCEHLTPKSLRELLHSVRSLCLPGARAVFGVPIETGLSGLAKGLYRMAKSQDDATLSNSLKSLFGLPIDRRITDVEWHGAHTGFNDKKFAAELARHFTIESTTCLPLPIGRAFNNEIYYVCRRD